MGVCVRLAVTAVTMVNPGTMMTVLIPPCLTRFFSVCLDIFSLLYHLALAKEEEIQRRRAMEERNLKARIEESKKTSIDDLTRGMINYTYLGLTFEKAENESLR